MKKILVLYYSQTGQLKQIVESLMQDLPAQCALDFAEIKPKNPFPFPWSAQEFFDVMPESVLRIPIEIEDMPQLIGKQYDLIIFGYQPWFLSPSQPATGFLKSKWAAVMQHTPVITVLGTRNMWLHAQECIKEELHRLHAPLVGNIVLEDRHGNLTSTLTIIRWLFKGQKEESRKLPAAGVSQEDIQGVARFGKLIFQHLQTNNWSDLQDNLLSEKSINLHPNLITLEKRGVKQFPKFARRAVRRGGPGSKERQPIIKAFQNLLILAIFVLSPISSLTAKMKTMLHQKSLRKEVDYFKSTAYQPGKFK